MSKIRSKNTGLELVVREFLYNKNFRFRVNYKLQGKPDIVFPRKKIIIFVNGCFWHRHDCKNSVIPETNHEFWRDKLNGNVMRDKKVEKVLKKEGWIVYKIWECELEEKTNKTLKNLETFIRRKSEYK